MPNLKLAEEWLAFAAKSLETAILLNRENHYTDVIAIDIQQTVEKSLKACYAFEGVKIPRTHSLDILFSYANQKVHFSGIEIKDITVIPIRQQNVACSHFVQPAPLLYYRH